MRRISDILDDLESINYDLEDMLHESPYELKLMKDELIQQILEIQDKLEELDE